MYKKGVIPSLLLFLCDSQTLIFSCTAQNFFFIRTTKRLLTLYNPFEKARKIDISPNETWSTGFS